MPALTYEAHRIVDLTLANAWGVQPASGRMTLTSEGGTPATGTTVALAIMGATFHGEIQTVEQVNSGLIQCGIVDNRIYFDRNDVFGWFNREIIVEDDVATPGIDRVRRYEHLLPEDYAAWRITRTDEPMTGKEILAKIFSADTVRFVFTLEDHGRLSLPAYNVDAERGKKLGVLLREVLDAAGLTVWLEDRNHLRFAEPGSGLLPVFPPLSGDRRLGKTATGAPTRVRVVGGRNLYQDSALFEADWNRKWEEFWSQEKWLEEVDALFGPFEDSPEGFALRAARAREIPVREYVAKKDETWADYETFGDVSRMEIPAWLYITEILFKVYRIKRGYVLNGLDVDSLEFADGGLLSAVKFNASTGAISYESPARHYPPGQQALVVAKGQPLEFLDPDQEGAITPGVLAKAGMAWASVGTFRFDAKDLKIWFSAAVFLPGVGDEGLFVFPNEGEADAPDSLKGEVVPNADLKMEPAQVRAAFVVRGETYVFEKGSGTRDHREEVQQLSRHILRENARDAFEVTYFDDASADDKAEALADQLLAEDPFVYAGGYRLPGVGGTLLSGVIRSVTTSLTFNEGVVEDVGFANEKLPPVPVSTREMERRRSGEELYPRQKEVADEARHLRIIAKQGGRPAPAEPAYRSPADVGKRPVSSRDCGMRVVAAADAGTAWSSGEVIFGAEGKEDAEKDAFLGVSIAQGTTGPARSVARSGVVPVKVSGAFNPGDVVGVDVGERVAKVGGSRVIGRINHHEGYAGTAEILVPVLLGSGAGASENYPFRPSQAPPPEGGGDPPADQAFRIVVGPGRVNDSVVQGNLDEVFTLAPDKTYTFYGEATVAVDSTVTELVVKQTDGAMDPNLPGSGETGEPPGVTRRAIFTVETGENGVNWGTLLHERKNYQIRRYVHQARCETNQIGLEWT